jgi:hypothetical protein
MREITSVRNASLAISEYTFSNLVTAGVINVAIVYGRLVCNTATITLLL